MGKMYYIWILFTIASLVTYQLTMKVTPHGVNPFVTLFVTYSFAAILCLICYVIFSHGESLAVNIKKLNWTSLMLVMGVVGIELGYMMAFRAGGALSTTSQVANSCAVVVLILLGAFVFAEKFSMLTIIGILMCFGGVILINIK